MEAEEMQERINQLEAELDHQKRLAVHYQHQLAGYPCNDLFHDEAACGFKFDPAHVMPQVWCVIPSTVAEWCAERLERAAGTLHQERRNHPGVLEYRRMAAQIRAAYSYEGNPIVPPEVDEVSWRRVYHGFDWHEIPTDVAEATHLLENRLAAWKDVGSLEKAHQLASATDVLLDSLAWRGSQPSKISMEAANECGHCGYHHADSQSCPEGYQ